MQSTTALLILNMVPGVLKDPRDLNDITPKIAQLIQHFKLYEQPICALCPTHAAAEARLVDGLQRYVHDVWLLSSDENNPFHAPAFQTWFSLQSEEQDYLIVGANSDGAVLQLASALHAHFAQKQYDQTVKVAIDAISPFEASAQEALRQLGVEWISTYDFINA
jgi:hypothetical protein